MILQIVSELLKKINKSYLPDIHLRSSLMWIAHITCICLYVLHSFGWAVNKVSHVGLLGVASNAMLSTYWACAYTRPYLVTISLHHEGP